jgi:hypothetical protein
MAAVTASGYGQWLLSGLARGGFDGGGYVRPVVTASGYDGRGEGEGGGGRSGAAAGATYSTFVSGDGR